MTQLLLDAGYGHGNGYTISLMSEPGEPHPELRDILMGHSCHAPALPKIHNCLKYSGRYDCTVQSGWFIGQAVNLCAMLKTVGVNMGIIAVPYDAAAYGFRIPQHMNWMNHEYP